MSSEKIYPDIIAGLVYVNAVVTTAIFKLQISVLTLECGRRIKEVKVLAVSENEKK